MKCKDAVLLSVLVLAGITTINSSSAQSGWAVVQRGVDYKVLQKTTVENGTNRVHRYVEVATGLCFTNPSGQLVDSKEQITILPGGGAEAVQGRHKLRLPSDIFNGTLQITGPDGRVLQSRPLCVTLDDGKSTAVIGVLTNSIGWLTASNQVTYKNCFTGIHADLVVNYRRSGVECDLVFRAQPPAPSACGLSDADSTIQLVTEFFNTQDPQQIPSAYDDWFGLRDDTLKFGKMTMGQGRAFSSSGRESAPTRQSRFTSAVIPVYKSWLHLGGRTFLIEQVPLVYIADELDALPLTGAVQSPKSKVQSLAANAQHSTFNAQHPTLSAAIQSLPPSYQTAADTNRILIASADLNQQPGVVLDFNVVDSDQSDFTFASGQTFFVSGTVNIGGTATFEGGAVLKCSLGDHGDGQINIGGSIVCNNSPDQPTIFTSVNDDSAGEVLPDSTGSPAIWDANAFLALDSGSSTNATLKNMRFSYAFNAIYCDLPLDVWDCQFINDGSAIVAGSDLQLHNVLIHRNADDDCVEPAITCCQGNLVAENVTVNHVTFINCWEWDGTFTLVNCLMTERSRYAPDNDYNIDYAPFDPPLIYTNDVVWVKEPQTPVYESAASADFYLAANSPYRDVGTTTINSDLLAELQTMTTYAPQDGSWPDTNAPDLGYHYPVNEDSDYDGLPDWWEWKYFGNYDHNSSDVDAFGCTLLFDYLHNYPPVATDSDNDGLPDWWELKYFGNLSQGPSDDYDGSPNNNFYDYQHGIDPNQIQFAIQFTNFDFTTNVASGPISVLAGVPSYMAVLVDDTNFADATWTNYTTNNVTVNLGSVQGSHDVWIGLRGLPADAQQTWNETQLILDTIPPTLAITNPATTTVSQAMIQLQGYANEELSSLTFDISNATVVLTNQLAYLTGQSGDTNNFQCPDIALAAGLNIITLHATDLAGNETTTHFSCTQAVSTNAPTLAIIWPPNGTKIGAGSFTIQAQVDNPAASISASVNGNDVQGIVEASGAAWVNDVPLNSGTNTVTVTASVAGNMNTATFNVVQSPVTITIDPLPTNELNQSYVTVTGTISDAGYRVWVNGIEATVSGDPTWEADNVPVSPSGTAVINVVAGTDTNDIVSAGTLDQIQPVTLILSAVWSSVYNAGYAPTGGFIWGRDLLNWINTVGGTDAEQNTGQGDDRTIYYFAHEYNLAGDYFDATEPVGEYAAVNTADFQNNTRTTLEIKPAGQTPAVGGTNYYLVTASGMEYSDLNDSLDFYVEGDTPLPPEWLAINGQNLINTGITNDDGSVSGMTLVSGLAGAAVPLAFTVTQFYTNHAASLQDWQARQVKLEIIDANTGADLTDNTNTVIVGQQMNLYCQLNITNSFMTNFVATNFQWTVPGFAISNYVVAADASSAMVVTNFPTTHSNVVFYWADSASNRTVQASAMVNGAKVTGQAAFNVLKPSADLLAFTNGAVTIDANGDSSGVNLYWGKAPLNITSTNYGIRFYATNIVLNGCPSSSTFKYVQLGTLQAEHNYTNGTSSQYTGLGLDTRYPAFSFSATEQFDHEEDEPGEPADGSAQVWRSDHFTMYLLFQPNSANSIPVPLKRLDWSWSGLAQTNGAGGWQLLSSSISLQNINVSAGYPIWTNNLTNGTTIASNHWLNPFP